MTTHSMEPLLPEDANLLREAEKLISTAAHLGRHLHPETLAAVTDLLRTVNCYYSNLIEGHDTHPIDIERAMKADYSRERVARNLQEEARAHIEVQLLMERRLDADPAVNVCSSDILCWLHREFYSRVPVSLRVVRDPGTGREEPVIPGALRHHDVKVGIHIAPPFNEVPDYLARFGGSYMPSLFAGPSALVSLAAAHHRLLWIHPFGDGNGRVARMMTDGYLRLRSIGGHGLWTASRGLARKRNEYLAALAEADTERWNDYDGRGTRSRKALIAFCEFFLSVCKDQINYMGGLLGVDALAGRVENYARARESALLPDRRGSTDGDSRLPAGSAHLLRDLMYRGKIGRGEVARLTGLPERTARRVVHDLLEEGFLSSESSRAPLRFRIPAHAGPYFFPDLYNPARNG
jgi:Fic family protein